jgi:hypothetical protein
MMQGVDFSRIRMETSNIFGNSEPNSPKAIIFRARVISYYAKSLFVWFMAVSHCLRTSCIGSSVVSLFNDADQNYSGNSKLNSNFIFRVKVLIKDMSR